MARRQHRISCKGGAKEHKLNNAVGSTAPNGGVYFQPQTGTAKWSEKRAGNLSTNNWWAQFVAQQLDTRWPGNGGHCGKRFM